MITPEPRTPINISVDFVSIFMNQTSFAITVDAMRFPIPRKRLVLAIGCGNATIVSISVNNLTWTNVSTSTKQEVVLTPMLAGNTTLTFKVDEYSEGYLAPRNVTVIINSRF